MSGKPKPEKGKSHTSGKHKTPRRPVSFPVKYLRVANQLAKKQKMPTLWYICDLILKEAAKENIPNLPLPPWEKNDKATDGQDTTGK